MAYLDTVPQLAYPLTTGFGLAVGSFLNVVILRLPKRMEWEFRQEARATLGEPALYDPPPPGIVVERSHCLHCGTQLAWYDNIPLASWLILRGKCRTCQGKISLQYPLVELLTAVLFLLCTWRFGFGWQGFGALVLTSFLIALSGIDLKTGLLPDFLTLPLMWLGLVASLDNLYMPAKPALLGAVVGYASLWTVWWLFRQLTGKDGMGHGDFKLLAALGAWCGLAGVLPIILLSSLLGLSFGVLWLMRKGNTRATPIPFGPCLALAGWVVFMWNAPLMALYWRMLG